MKIAVILFFTALVSVQADWNDRYQEYPFRIMEGKECDLRPLFAWLKSQTRARPLGRWNYMDWEVVQTVRGTIILTKYSELAHEWMSAALTNYPHACHDGQNISFVSVERGLIRLKDYHDVERTLRLLDFGIPFTPLPIEPLPKLEKTNSVAAHRTNKFEIVIK